MATLGQSTLNMTTIDDIAQNFSPPCDTAKRPLISIITINFNNQAGLARTLSSASQQTYGNWEQIVVDGGSGDGSVEVIHNPNFKIDRWVSEPDRGIYHAMNKGIRMARGRYLMFLNSGDHLLDSNTLAMAAEVIADKDIYYFSLQVRPQPGGSENRVKTYPQVLTFSYFSRFTLPHQSSFLKADLFERYGYYDESLRICSDWKHFMLCICRHNCSYAYDPRVVGVFYTDGLTSSLQAPPIDAAERRKVMNEEFPAFLDDLRLRFDGEIALKALAALRASRTIRWAQHLGLLWHF